MDTRRLATAVSIALILSVFFTGWFYLRLTRQQAANRNVTVKVVAASVDIAPGVAVTQDSLKLVDWPKAQVVQGLVTKQEDIVGHALNTSIPANEPIFEHDIASPGNNGLAARIPDGMRAVAVKTDEVNNLSGFIFPGSRVDVLATLRNANTPYTVTVLQNVQVLSAGENIVADPSGKPQNVKIVTVLVTPEDSQKLALAMEQGSVRLDLRNMHDDQKVNTPTLNASDLGGMAPKPVQQAVVVKRAEAPKPPPTYAVETITGAKSSVATFDDTKVR